MYKDIKYRHQGFTLLELLLVIAIMAITLAIGLPSMQDMMAQNRLTTSANDMLAALQTARSEAVKRIQNCGVSLSGNTWVTFVSISSNSIQQFSAAKGITVTPSVDSSSTVSTYDTPTFRPDGRLDQQTTITMSFSATGSTATRILTIVPSGKVTITNPNT